MAAAIRDGVPMAIRAAACAADDPLPFQCTASAAMSQTRKKVDAAEPTRTGPQWRSPRHRGGAEARAGIGKAVSAARALPASLIRMGHRPAI